MSDECGPTGRTAPVAAVNATVTVQSFGNLETALHRESEAAQAALLTALGSADSLRQPHSTAKIGLNAASDT